MNILQQLRHEVDHKQESEFVENLAQQQLEQNYRSRILPKMQKTFLFLKEVIEHLNYLDKKIEIEEYSSNYPDLETLYQTQYKINTDGYGGFADFDRIMQINVTFACMGEGSFIYTIEGQHKIEQEVSFLNSKSLLFNWSQYMTPNGIDAATFNLTRKIPVRFRFEVDYSHSKIKLLINNHENFNTYIKTFEPEAINDELLDEVLRFMLRKDCDFIQLEITSQDKQKIQKRAEEEQLQRAKWLEEIQLNHPTTKSAPDAQNNFFQQFKSLMNKKIL